MPRGDIMHLHSLHPYRTWDTFLHATWAHCWCQLVGLGAILMQVTADGGTNIVAHSSCSLTNCKSRYSQTEREAPAVVWGIEHFHLYLYWSSDHKSLEIIFNNPICKVTARLDRLQQWQKLYKTKLVYQPEADNPADYMSHHSAPKQSDSQSFIKSGFL